MFITCAGMLMTECYKNSCPDYMKYYVLLFCSINSSYTSTYPEITVL